MPPPVGAPTSAVVQNGSAIPLSGQGPHVPIYDDNGQDVSGSLPPPRQLDVNAPDPRGVLGRARAAFEEGSAGTPGFSSETLEQPGFTGSAARAFQPYVRPVDAALKLATGLGRGFSAGISGLLGGNETEQNQIDREIRNFTTLELARSASPGAYTGGGAMIADALKSVPKIGETIVNQVGIGTSKAAEKLRENTIKALETGGQRADDLRAIQLADDLMATDPAAVARRSDDVSEIRGKAEALHRALADTAGKERLVIEGNIPGANQELAALQEQRQALVTALENLGTPNRAPFSGIPRGMTEAGGEAQSALVKAQEEIIKSRDATRLKLQTQVDDLVVTKENAQASIADLATAQSMLEEAKSVLNPDVTTANTATSTGAAISKDIRQVNQQIKDALANRTVSLTANEKNIAEANNLPVTTIPGRPAVLDKEGKIISEAIPETYERTFKSTWEAIDNLRRQFGEAFNGNLQGYAGVDKKVLRDKYDQLKKLQGEFIDLHPEMQKSWADALAAEEEVTSGIGKSLTAIGKDEALTANPTNVVSDIVAQGKTGLAQHLKKGGDAKATLTLAEDALEQAFYSPTKPLTYEQAAKAVAVNTKLGDMLNALPEVLGTEGKALKSRVDSYLTRLRDAEQSDVNTANIKTNISSTESKLGEVGTRKSQLEKAVGEKQKIEAFNKGLALELATVPTEKALERSRTAWLNFVKNENISEEQGRYWLDRITKAQEGSLASSGKVPQNLGNKIKRFQNELREEPVETLLAREGNGSIEVKIRFAADKNIITAEEHEVLLKALRKVQALNQNKTRVPATAAAVWNVIKTAAKYGLAGAGVSATGYGLSRLFKD